MTQLLFSCIRLFPRRQYFLFFVIASWIHHAHALASLPIAAPALEFQHLTIDDGLSQGMVTAICQDRQGFMWFGTKDGLNRYDGYQFTVFRNHPFDSTSLSHNYITEIFEDSRGRLWVGTWDGLNCFDPATEKFRRFLHDPDDPHSLSNNEITAICEAPGPPGRDSRVTVLWIGTFNGGVNKLVLRETDHDFIRYAHKPDDPNSLRSNRIRDLLVDRCGVVWIGTSRGLCRFDPPRTSSGAANRGDIFVCYVREANALSDSTIDDCTSLFESGDGAIWVGMRAGLARLAPDTVSPGYLKSYDFLTTSHWQTSVNEICENHQGTLWLATFEGLVVFDPSDKTFRRVRHEPEASASLSYDGLNTIFRDRSDAIWIGTAGFGLNRWDPHAKQFHTYNSENLGLKSENEFGVSILMEDSRGVVWTFAKGGLYLFNRNTSHLAYNPLNIPFKESRALHEDHEGFVWSTTPHTGIFRYDGHSDRIEKILPSPGDSINRMFAIYEDDNGDMWFGSNNRLPDNFTNSPGGRHALYRWSRDSETLADFMIPVPESMTGGWLEIRQIGQHQSGVFWLATNRGLFRFELDSGALKIFQNEPTNPESLSNNDVKTLLFDPLRPDRFLWLGTNGGGLSRFDLADEKFSHYAEAQGLPNSVVYGILTDDAGNLWMSTNKGLSKAVLAPETREIIQFKNYDVRDGLQSNEFNTKAYFKNAVGEMLFGGIKGFTVFHPDSIRDNAHVPPVVFTDLQIEYQSVKPGQPGSPLQKTINTAETITLAPEENVLTFEFAALDYSAPQKNLYSYMLEGFESEWSVPSHERRTTYTNLDPGEYTLRVRGSNNDGVWNEAGAAIQLIVTPPWWQTWWAYTIYFLLIAVLLYGLRRYELSRIRLKDQVKLEQIEAKKLHELDQMKSRFFANISHEFRTPLTLILGPIENMLGRPDDKPSKQDLKLMHKNAGNLLRLVNQLLDLARLESSKVRLQASKDDLVQCLKSVLAFFESLARSRNIALHFRCELESLEAWFNRDHLEKVFYNLLSNAIKFTPDGGTVAIAVAVGSGNSSGNSRDHGAPESSVKGTEFVEITIADTGIGISADELPFVFDRFYQTESASTRKSEGTGIGLALVKELVELHHGEVCIRSEAGTGTEALVRLPLGSKHLRPEEIVQAASGKWQGAAGEAVEPEKNIPSIHADEFGTTVPATQPSGEETIVLVVEDNADMRAYIRQHLESAYRVLEAADGKEGFDKAVAEIPDLVISDVMMPKMDGYALCEQLKTDERTSHIPVILLTAKAEQEDKLEGLETGADDHLTKPFDARELHARVRNLIALRRQLQEKFKRQLILHPTEVHVDSIDEAFLKKAVAIVEENLQTESFSVEDLARQSGMSRVQLHRKLRALTNQPASHFIRAIRLQRAAELIKKNTATITEIAYQVGFNSHPYFTKCFQEYFGLTPTEYKKKEF